MLFLAADPTGLSSPVGQLAIVASLLAAVLIALRWFWQQRKR